jgi:hypothetical protein
MRNSYSSASEKSKTTIILISDYIYTISVWWDDDEYEGM